MVSKVSWRGIYEGRKVPNAYIDGVNYKQLNNKKKSQTTQTISYDHFIYFLLILIYSICRHKHHSKTIVRK